LLKFANEEFLAFLNYLRFSSLQLPISSITSCILHIWWQGEYGLPALGQAGNFCHRESCSL